LAIIDTALCCTAAWPTAEAGAWKAVEAETSESCAAEQAMADNQPTPAKRHREEGRRGRRPMLLHHFVTK